VLHAPAELKFEFIDMNRTTFPVQTLCEVLGVSPSGYYARRTRPASARERANDALEVEIRAIHAESRQRYGSRKVHATLRRHRRVNHKRVARLMRKNGLRSRRARRVKVTTDSEHGLPVAANLLNREFRARRPNAKWVSDITFVPTHEGWLYLAVVLDLFARRVVGWVMQETMTRALVMAAFEQAARARGLAAGLLFHSDRGSQYASADFVDLIGVFEVTQSMSRAAEVYDNAVMESFFASYKTECVPAGGFATRAQARSETFEYIEVFYNRQRLHSTLGYQTPAEAERAVGVS
jgi:transposase InsO family protein